ncbi:hypothetical protein REH81_04145 [Vibrio rotiferianus]
MINASVSLNLRVVRGGVGTVATITKSIQLPNVYETDEGIATSLVLTEGQTISPELRIESVDSEDGTVHLYMTHPFGVNLDKFIEGTTFDELAEKMKAVGWEVVPNNDGLRDLDEHNKIMAERDAKKSVPDENLSDAAYAKKYKLKTTAKQRVVIVITYFAFLVIAWAAITSVFNLTHLELTGTTRTVSSLIMGGITSLISQRIITSWLVKNHREQTVEQSA